MLKKKKERTQIKAIKTERGEITTNTAEIQTILRAYCEQLYTNKMGNLGEMDKSQETYKLPKLKQEERKFEQTKRSKENELVIKNLPLPPPPTKRKIQSPGPDGFPGEFSQTFREEFTSILLKLLQKTETEGTLPSSFYEATISLIPNPDRDPMTKENDGPISLMNMDAKLLNKLSADRIQQ